MRHAFPTLRRLLATLLVGALVGAGPAAPGRADEAPDAEERLHDVLLGLAASEPERRLEALERLDHLARAAPGLAVRALPRLRQVLRLRPAAERAPAGALLTRLASADAKALWLERLDPEVEADDTVLAAAVAATSAVPADAELQRLLVARIRDARTLPACRALALEALGGLAGPGVDLVLHHPREDEPWVEACGRALGLGRRDEDQAVDALLAIWSDAAEIAPRIHAWESLVRVTKQGLPFDVERWRTWWQSRPAPAARAAGAPGGDGRYATAAPAHVPHYYGVPIQRPAGRVVFCLDVSQSMYGTGITSARRELRKTLMEFSTTHAFEIIAFNAKILPWAGRLVRAHPVQKLLALRWLDGLEPTNYTNLYDAVETAMGLAGRGARPVEHPVALDAIFLLSDGAPNRGRHRDARRIVEGLARLSGREIPIHTIGAGEEVFPLLRAIARETGGTFVDAFD